MHRVLHRREAELVRLPSATRLHALLRVPDPLGHLEELLEVLLDAEEFVDLVVPRLLVGLPELV